MIRNFDTWNRYLDNNNKPLKGCVMFNRKDGNTVAEIFDADGTPLENPILTDIYGRTQHQVFIKSDVVAYFYKYIGHGIYNSYRSQDIDVNDDTLWYLQYTIDNINDIMAHISSDNVIAIENIEALRNLDIDTVPTVAGYKVITLLGYNEIGDKEPINYVWNAESTDNDNNGSIIQGSELTGRWLMVKPTEHCDCKHFGIFASNTTNFEGNTPRFTQWIDYCNSVNIKPYFSAEGDYRYYKYTSLNFTTEAIDVADEVIFLDEGSSTWSVKQINGNPYFYNHATKLSTDYVKTSWGANLFVSPKVVDIDDNEEVYTLAYSNCVVNINDTCDKALSFSNCTVNVNKQLTNEVTFTNCIINSKNKLNNSIFYNCKLTEDMFNGSPSVAVDGNCIADFNDFEHKEAMWLSIKSQQGQVNYDWQGRITSSKPWTNLVEADRKLANYNAASQVEIVEGDNAHTYYFENCSGEFVLPGKAANVYVFKDCEVTLSFKEDYQKCTIKATNSSINVAQLNMTMSVINLQNASLIGSGTIDVDTAYVYSSSITIPVKCGYCDIKDSNIADKIELYGIDFSTPIVVDPDPEDTNPHTTYNVYRRIAGNFINNVITGQIEIGAEPYGDVHATLADLVRGLNIINNLGLSENPIVINRTMSSAYDNYNVYEYKGNKGTMSMQTSATGAIVTSAFTPGTQAQVVNIDNIFYCTTNRTDTTGYGFLVKLFTIGTKNVHTNMMTSVRLNEDTYSQIAGCNQTLESDSYNPEIAYNGTGFVWRLRNAVLGVGLTHPTASQCDIEFVQV